MATAVVIFLATMVATYSLFLLVVVQPWSVAYEDHIGQQVEYVRVPQAIVPFLCTLMIFGGLVVKRRIITWLGTIILLVFSLWFLFGVGGIILPVAGAILLLIAIIRVLDSSQ